MHKHSRKKKLIKPALQLRLAAIFTVTALAAVIIQAFTLHRSMMKVAEFMPNDGDLLRKIWPEVFRSSVTLTAILIVLTVYLVGVTITHSLAGPIFRFEEYLRGLRAGRSTEPCKLRKGDQLQELCSLLNDATASLRGKSDQPAPASALPSAMPAARPTEHQAA